MPISSSACPCGAPGVTSLRPSRLATRVAGAAVESPGTVIPACAVTSLFADAALMASVPNATPAARAAPMPNARRRFVVLLMMVLPDPQPTSCARPAPVVRRLSGPAPIRTVRESSQPPERTEPLPRPYRCRVGGRRVRPRARDRKVRAGSPAVAARSTRRTAPGRPRRPTGQARHPTPIAQHRCAAVATNLSRLLDQPGVESTAMLGYSNGGAVAQQLALDDRNRCAGLVLACAYAFNMASPREQLDGHLAPLLIRRLGIRGWRSRSSHRRPTSSAPTASAR